MPSLLSIHACFELELKVFKVTLMGTVVYSDDVFYPVLLARALFFHHVLSSQIPALFNVYYRFVLTRTQDIQLNSQAK